MNTKQYVSRTCSFDFGHRVMNNWSQDCSVEQMSESLGTPGPCSAIHGHSYLFDLMFEFDSSMSSKKIGYNIDFKEIKRVFMAWIEEHLDHGFCCNPEDVEVRDFIKSQNFKLWIMSLNDKEFCNPSVENIAKEVFLAFEILCEKFDGLVPYKIKINETPNCYTECYSFSITDEERSNFRKNNYESIKSFSEKKGVFIYDKTLLEGTQCNTANP